MSNLNESKLNMHLKKRKQSIHDIFNKQNNSVTNFDV